MKKLMLAALLLLNFFALTSNVQKVEAAEEEFPYEGYYMTEENRYIKGFVFEDHAIYIVFQHEDERNAETKNHERWLSLINQDNFIAVNLDPESDPEDIVAWREENLPDLAAIYSDVAERITPNMTREEVDAMIDAQIPSVDLTNAYLNTVNLFSNPFIKINAPTIVRSQNIWRVEVYTNLLARFEYEENTDGSTITDDYGVTYTKQEEMPALDE